MGTMLRWPFTWMRNRKRLGMAVCCLGILFFAGFCFPAPLQAATLVFPGDPLTGDDLLPPGDEPSNNTVTVNDGAIPGGVFGGRTVDGPAGNNTVTINGGTVGGTVAGGQTKNGDADGNTVTVTGGTLSFVTGGETENGHSSGNTVTVKGNAVITGNSSQAGVYGGTAGTKGSTVTGNVTGNKIFIESGAIQGLVTGGRARLGNASSNTVSVSGGTIENTLYGGRTDKGAASDNAITITGGTLGFVAGGRTDSGDASKNTVTVTGNAVIMGDSSQAAVYGAVAGTQGSTATGNVSGNTVRIDGGDIRGIVTGGRTRLGNAADNKVTIAAGTIALSVHGGRSDTGLASGNSVVMTGGTVGGSVYGGLSEGGDAKGNKVTISGGTVEGDVYGGWATHPTYAHEASGNTVIIEGNATITGVIYGGFVNSGPEDKAINNVVIIRGTPNLVNADIRVGKSGDPGSDTFTGNTLIVEADKPVIVKSVSNVEKFEFLLPADAGGDYVALQADSIAFGDGKGNPSSVSSVKMAGGGTLDSGDSITLFRLSDGSTPDTTQLETPASLLIPGRKGVSLLYDLEISSDGSAVVTNMRANPQAKAFSEGFLAGLALTNQGADLVAGKGMESALRSANQGGVTAFGVVSGGTSRYDAGSHLDMNSVSTMAGLAWGAEFTAGRLTLGGFFEYGNGSYDTHNSFSNAASVDGDGHTYYLGGGVLGRMDFADTGPGHFHVETSVRAGKVHNEYENSDLRDISGEKAEYDVSSAYYGAHLGSGYTWKATDKASFDLYAKYFWTRQEGDSVTLSTDDPVKFKDADSHRLRGGVRFDYALSEQVTPYFGAAYEHEFDGKVKATTYGHGIKRPDLSGGTGIGEIGLTVKPTASLPLSFDLGVQGYVGKREGVTGSLQLKWEF